MNTSNSESAMTTPVNPGERLRQSREARHWSRAEVALQLHLSEDAVRYIEDGLFDKLPGATFARGYIRSYAKLLGLDATELAHEFDQFTGTQPAASTPQGLSKVQEPARLSHNVLRGGLFALSLVAVASACSGGRNATASRRRARPRRSNASRWTPPTGPPRC